MFEPQIHIVFNSEEKERITDPIIESKPNKLYYFKADPSKLKSADEFESYFKENIEILKKKIPTLEIIIKLIDFTDYFHIIQEISKLVKNERSENEKCKIYINIGAGSKLTAIASIEAAKIWNLETYYVYSQEVSLEKGPKHSGEMIIRPIKSFPIQKPPENFIRVLKVIEKMIGLGKKFVYKKNLLYELKKEGLLNLITENPDLKKNKSSEYMALNQRYLNPLEKQLKFINISDDKRNKKISLTEEGLNILKIFKYYIYALAY